MANISQLQVAITGDASGLVGAAKEAALSLGGLEKAATGLVSGLAKVGLAAQGLKTLGEAATGMASGLVKGNAQLEMTTVAFTTMLGSGTKAQALLHDISNFAATTPFELKGLTDSSKKLLAFGFEAKQIIPTMTGVGNAIAGIGGGQPELDRIVLALGQMKAKGKIAGDELLQLSELGIPGLQMLADGFGVSTAKMQDMVSKGLVPADQGIQVLIDGMNKKFPNMMEAQSKTFSGLLSNIKDWAYQTYLTLSKPFFDPMKKGLQSLYTMLTSSTGQKAVEELTKKIQTGVDSMVKVFNRGADAVKSFASALNGNWVDAGPAKIRALDRAAGLLGATFAVVVPHLKTLVEKFLPLAEGVSKVYSALSPLNIAIGVLKGFLTGGLAGGISALDGSFKDALTTISTLGTDLLTWVGNQGPKLLEKLGEWATNFVEWAAPVAGKLLEKLGGVLTDLINWVALKAPGILSKLGEWAKAFIEWVAPLIPPLLAALGNLALSIGGWIVDQIPGFVNQLGQWAGAFWGWVTRDVIPAVGARLGPIWDNISKWIGDTAPKVWAKIGEWGSAFLGWVDKDVLPKIPGTIGTIASTIGDWVVATAGVIGPKLGEWGKAFIDWMGEVLPKVPGMIGEYTGKVLEWIGAQAGNILPKFENEWAPAFWKWVGEVWPQVNAKLGEFMDSLSNWFTQQGLFIHDHIGGWTLQAVAAIGDWTISMKNALLKGIGEIGTWFGQLIGQMWSDWWTGWEQNGGKLVDGLIKGIGDAWNNLTGSVREKVTGLIDFVKGLFGIASPSTVFAAIGEDIVNGLLQGLNNIRDQIISFFSGLKDDMVNAVKEAVEKIGGLLGALAGAFNKAIHGDIAGAFNDLKTYATGASSHLNGKFDDISNGAAAWVTNIKTSVTNFGAALATAESLAATSASIISGGISSSFSNLAGNILSSTSNLITFNATPANEKTVNTNFSSVFGAIKDALDKLIAWNSTPAISKSATYTTTYRQIGSPSPVPYASGTDYHPGGPALIGEAGPEFLKMPGMLGRFMVTAPTVFPDLPTGSQVIPYSGGGGGGNTTGTTTNNNQNNRTVRLQGNVYITIAPPAGTDEKKIAQMVADKLQQLETQKQRNRSTGFANRGI